MKYINMSIVYLSYKVFVILEIKVVLISYNLSGDIKSCWEQCIDCIDKATAYSTLARVWYWQNRGLLPAQTAVISGS